MDLMSTASPEKPSRYAMRLAVDERPIYDRMCFVAGVRHFISPDEWTLRITLDIAEWAGQYLQGADMALAVRSTGP